MLAFFGEHSLEPQAGGYIEVVQSAFLSAVRAAGVVGMGGAGFPSHVKYAARAGMLIANGCECEPLLASDRHLMLHEAPALLEAMRLLAGQIGATRCVIAIKAKHKDLAVTLRQAAGKDVELALLPDFYPAGDEQTLLSHLSGRSVPPLGLPLDVDALVANVATLFNAGRAALSEGGLPLTRRLLTVAGQVRTPAVLDAPLGLPLTECIQACGGLNIKDSVYILGGPLMGRLLDSETALEKAVVTKTLSGLIVLPQGHPLHLNARQKIETMRRRAKAACIQCRLCTELCPRYLNGQPFETHRIMRAFAAGQELAPDSANEALLCCECGICELMACPMNLSPRRINIAIKNRLRERNAKYQGGRDTATRPFAAYRRVPGERLALRLGLGPYLAQKPRFLPLPEPRALHIPLKQHIGAPALPIVKTGDLVRAGALLAEIPQGALGARVHAGLSGMVTVLPDSISIIAGGPQ